MDPSGDDGCEHQDCNSVATDHSSRHVSESLASKYARGWRRIVRNFTPSWFCVNMGTGIVSVLLYDLPYNGRWLYWLSIIVFCLNVLLFVAFLGISVVRYAVWPEVWVRMLKHPVQSLFFGAFPIGLATIINMVVFVCVPAWGRGGIALAWALWWIDAVISLATCLYLPFVIMSYHHPDKLQIMTAAWLLPVSAPVVAAATGGLVAGSLTHSSHALWTIVISYVLWGTGVPLALTVLTMYFQRLTIHSLPPREVVVSVFLPLGPLSQGAFAVMQLGKVARSVLPDTGTLGVASAGDILYVVGWVLALMMWGYGVVWMFFAFATVTRVKRFPFNLAWWGFTFPLGTFTVATTTIGKEMPATFFNVLGTILSVAVVLLWLSTTFLTLKYAWRGLLFVAPCRGVDTITGAVPTYGDLEENARAVEDRK